MEHEAVVFPVQQLDLVVPPVGEGVQPAVKGVVADLLLDQRRQPSEALTEVDGVPVQIDVRHPYRRPEVAAHDSRPIRCRTTGVGFRAAIERLFA